MLITILGLFAAFCTTISFLPQVLKTWKSKKTKDISLSMYLILDTGVFLWAIYGFAIHAPPVYLANIVTFILVSLVLFLKYKYG